MIRGRPRFIRAALIALCLTAPALAATSPGVNDTTDSGIDSLDVTRHAMPPPDITAKPAPAAPEAAPAVSANPLWAVPLSALAATRDRPLFTPSRRPPAPIIASAPVVVARPPPPPPPAAPEHPNLTLVGTVAGENEGVAVFIDKGTRDTVRLRTGEGHMGWVLQSVERSTATLQKGSQTETLELPRPTAMQAPTPPVITALPPPPQSGTSVPAEAPQQSGCMPAPVGC